MTTLDRSDTHNTIPRITVHACLDRSIARRHHPDELEKLSRVELGGGVVRVW
jgi:hypothetical protein